ncbi:MAG: hypothetical protein K8T20_15540 [Planctomycetes bacterium]|nr:hypothetical protein [Planctomycetota bacterium]
MHPAVLTELKKRWELVKGNHESVHIGEYAEGDWVMGRTDGDPVNCWVWDGSDLQDVGADVRQERKAKAGGVFVQAGMRFAFNPEEEGIVLIEFVTGVLSGSGTFMKISGDGESLLNVPEGQKWGA